MGVRHGFRSVWLDEDEARKKRAEKKASFR